MDEILTKVVNMKCILMKNLSKKDKVISAFKALSGLELTKLNKKTKNALVRELSSMNYILKQYQIVTFDDYDQITNAHLDELICIANNVCLALHKFMTKQLISCPTI